MNRSNDPQAQRAEDANSCLDIVTNGAIVLCLPLILFGIVTVLFSSAKPAGIVMIVVGVVLISLINRQRSETRDDEVDITPTFVYNHHFFDKSACSGWRQQGSSYECAVKYMPDWMRDAVRECYSVDPRSYYSDAFIVKSIVTGSEGNYRISDGIVTYRTMQQIKGAPIAGQIKSDGTLVLSEGFKKGFLLSWNEIEDWRERR